MEAVASLFTVGGTAAAASTAATTATAAATAASTAWSVLQGAATAVSIAAALGGGVMALAEGKKQAEISEIEAGQARIASEQTANRIKREWLEKTGAARVAFGASGVDIGSAASIEDGLTQQYTYATGIERENMLLRQISAKARGEALEDRGEAGLLSGIGQAAGTAARYAIDIRNRG